MNDVSEQVDVPVAKVKWDGPIVGTCECSGFIVAGDNYCSKCGRKIENPLLSMKDRAKKVD